MIPRPIRRLLGLTAASALVLLAGYALPRRTAVERTQEIAAPAATLYELISDLRASRRWSPWRDARSRYLFSGPAMGVGTRMDWSGRTRGASTVERAERYSLVVHRVTLDGRERLSSFRLTPSAQGVRVAWRMEADAGNDLLARWSGLLFPSRMGANLERGLDRLGDVAEALPHADMAASRVRLVQAPVRRFALVDGETAGDPAAVARALAAAHARVRDALRRNGLQPSGGPVWIAVEAGADDRISFRAGSSYTGNGTPSGSGVALLTLPAGPSVEAEQVGSAETLPQAEAAARLFAGIHQLAVAGPTLVTVSEGTLSGAGETRLTLQLPVRAGA